MHYCQQRFATSHRYRRFEKIIDDIIAANPAQLADYRSGKDKLFGFFVGQVMKATHGKANPQQVNEILQKLLQ